MRGKACGDEQERQQLRITPAYAGKSEKTTFHFDAPQDHPRLCGEKQKC